MASAARAGNDAPLEPPPRLARALREAGDAAPAGRTWLAELPVLTRDALRRWELAPERVQEPGGRSSLLVLVRRADGGRAALKLVPPGADAAAQRAALARWDGFGAVRLLEADEAAGALLLERLHGEVSLSSLPEAKALLEAAGTVRRLWTEPDAHPYPSVADRTARAAALLRTAADEPWAADVRPLAGQALAAHAELTAAEPERLLLHGRFREGKVLAGERAPWLAVGPDPLVGERAYDLALPVRDRLEDLVAAPGGAAAARRRLGRLADSLEVDRERLRGWTVFRAVADGLPALGRGHRRGALLLEFASWF
ncbi:kinase [Streptomyces sp. F63]|uniref:aminoglycoside phosphotransferase family protein n=1 Tax=Streptomyces sp. F63 TaxID=2824887 RepID=UPI001B379C9F|nr:aminoglycoside phosphotransferase family protein [Streptomyces sp. F63]MBQ0984392.1 kinase [Streptomyces sp. F63]